jgi:hypothetical protein
VRSFLLVAALLVSAARASVAQVAPNADWRTLHTKHFRIHFASPLETEARRAAVNAERAYAQLSTELVPPRGIIDLVLSDDVDYVNGYATTYPSNRIVVYANPPTDASGLRRYEDWNALVVTHELTHIFHLDRTRGIWRVAQAVFGRNPLLFPNLYEPRWVLEGLAVYYESRITGFGRLESSEHLMTARAAALANDIPTLQELSPGTSRFPGGEIVYVYGSLLFDYLSRTRGPKSVRDFVEIGAKTPLPFILTITSRKAFGMSFQTAWQHWRDSLMRETREPHEIMPGWRQLTNAGYVALFPRWLGDTTLIYAGDKAREMPGAYRVGLSGAEKRLGRRNGPSPNVRLPDGGVLFAQLDYTSPYNIRSDLFVERNGEQTRLTRGARLTMPDVRSDGEIVAVQDQPATTRLVRVSSDGNRITPITTTSLDAQWSDPRWSPDGSRIVAVRQSRGRSEIVILDGDGKVIDSFGATRAINSAPSWSPDGKRVYFSSERSGSPQIYVADVTTFGPSVSRITDAPTGVFAPEVAPDQSQLATLLFKADGYHLGVGPLRGVRNATADSTRVSPRAGCVNCIDSIAGLPALGAADSSRATRYSALPTLLPRYWLPVLISTTNDGFTYGLQTDGTDVIGRHQYTLDIEHNNRFAENSAWLTYRYAGFGLPLMDLFASQSYSNGSVYADINGATLKVGDLLEQDRYAALKATFVRPRFRTYSLMSIGPEIERITYATAPDTLFPHLNEFYQNARTFPGVIASAGWSNAQRPGLSISPEDGIAASVSARQRWSGGTAGASTRSIVGTTSMYKSLDLPGPAHHVIAVRVAGGITDDASPNLFSAGGLSGTTLDIFPGYSFGQQRRTFGIRGYPPSAESGIRAYAGTAEYRAPLFTPSRGFRFIPVFIDRASLSVFGETGRAYCPSSVGTNTVCRTIDIGNRAMTSVGAELNFDTALQLDEQARFRFGLAFPLANRQELGAARAQAYATFGSSF